MAPLSSRPTAGSRRRIAALLWLSFIVGLLPAAWAQKVVAPASIAGSRLVTAHEATELIASTPALRVFDCRLAEEYAKGHIEGSLNVTDGDLTTAVLARYAPDKTMPLLFYCNGPGCLRSARAVGKAVGWGYRTVYWFRGGMEEWLERRLPLMR